MKLACVVGVRPEFIQVEPILSKLHSDEFLLVHSGQHYDYEMSRIFFDELNIPEPNYYLCVGSGSQGYQMGEMIKRFEEVFLKEMPTCVLVFGDTNTTLAGALAAAKIHIPVAHVEAGLRSFDRSMPEEINRITVDHISSMLFAPTANAVMNLNYEGIKSNVYYTGDVMYDSLLDKLSFITESRNILNRLNLKPKDYFLLTIHRAENTENVEKMRRILLAIFKSNRKFVFPAHPRVKKFLEDSKIFELPENIQIISPLGYLDFLELIYFANKILTDSGGIQKQAFMLGTPCITLRENTEWIETQASGWNVLVGSDTAKIYEMINSFAPENERGKVYGDGNASRKIIDILRKIC